MYPKCRKYQHFRVVDKNLGKSLIITLWWIFKKIGQYIAMHKTDYDFAKFMIEMPITERLGWISDNFI